jgi:tRNA1(Val) A37 N6-methylase TrmN6
MNTDGLKKQIETSIANFAGGNFKQSAIALLNTLGYSSNKTINIDSNPKAFLAYSRNKSFNEDKARFNEWHSIDLLFQITSDELPDSSTEDNKRIDSYIFYALELKGTRYSRTDLASITREVNKIRAVPALILFKYNGMLTISIIDRRLNKKDENKDVLEKVILIKDICIADANRAHKEILFDLSLNNIREKHTVANFVDLHTAWMEVLNISELNKRFYHEIADWYFWARDTVKFPDNAIYPDVKTNSSINTIRLLTRIIFVWFLKEKGLVPEKLFNENKLKEILVWDKDESCYYKAILQNLFFATLNTEMNKDKKGNRGFADEGPGLQPAHYGIKSLYRYQNLFKISAAEAVKLFEGVPFLNGGLFDCLDKEEPGTKKVNYIDGFTRNKKLQPIVPNKLFFGSSIVNLEKEYGDNRGKEEVSGLIDILKSYKFTVAENTPIEEEIALDPELLGKIFENLLASYNPETEITARKQMGAFYTPREIVNYMVDEALTSYLKNYIIRQYEKKELVEKEDDNEDIFGNYVENQIKLEVQKKELSAEQLSEIDEKIRLLLSYSEEQPFSGKDKLLLIKAIEEAKILDPACGSGAFPMGVLHKLVHILHKLDPQNNLWKERQLNTAAKIEDRSIREEVLSYIENAFNPENNFSDYGRKLFLIQNCIYGVDIQEVAVQISKLRFFISLLIDQKVNRDKPNNGILSLPNLETRFIAANTLIGIDNNLGGFFEDEIRTFEDKLKIVREKHFNAKSRAQKIKAIEEEKLLRESLVKKVNTEIKERNTGIQETIANLERECDMRIKELAKPKLTAEKKKALKKEIEKYNSRISSLNSEIENNSTAQSSLTKIAYWEPYDQNTHAEFFDPDWMFGVKNGFDIVIGNPPYVVTKKGKYKAFCWEGDLYTMFFELSVKKLLKEQGCLSIITPRYFLFNQNNYEMRKYLLNRLNILSFVETNPFEAITENLVTILTNEKPKSNKIYFYSYSKSGLKYTNMIKKDWINANAALEIIPSLTEKIFTVLQRIKGVRKTLGDISDSRRGAEIGKVELKQQNNGKLILIGNDVNRYTIKPTQAKISTKHEEYIRLFQMFNDENIILLRRVAQDLIATVPEKGMAFSKNLYGIKPNKKYNKYYLTALLNSKVLNFYYKHKFSTKKEDVYPEIQTYLYELLPIQEYTNSNSLIKLVKKIISLKKKDPEYDFSMEERIINQRVFKIYGLTYGEVRIIDPDFELSKAEYEAIKI